MFYTLVMWAWWLVVAAAIGGVGAWMLRGAREPRKVGSDAAEREAALLRARVDDLQLVARERDRLRAELELRPVQSAPENLHAVAAAELDRDLALRHAAEQAQWVAELRVRLWNAEAHARDLQAVIHANSVPGGPPRPDLVEGSRVLGVPVVHNDFTLIEGIGPRIAQLLTDKGIVTWWALANTDLELLRSVLREAGPKFQVHDPRSWPHQARLLAFGDWDKFRTLAAALRYGHPTR